MKTMQQRLLEEIDRMAVNAGVELSISYNWTNTGTLYVLRQDEPVPRDHAAFDFQNTYVLFKETMYNYSTDMRAFLAMIERFIKGE